MKRFLSFLIFNVFLSFASAQSADSLSVSAPKDSAATDSALTAVKLDAPSADSVGSDSAKTNLNAAPEKEEPAVIQYTQTPREYTIQDIEITGADSYDKDVIRNYSGLHKGQRIKVPGSEISAAIKRFWKQGLFGDVKIFAKKIEGDKIWLEIAMKQRPRASEINIYGMKKKEQEDVLSGIGIVKGSQISPNILNRAKRLLKKKLEEKGFEKAEVSISTKDDPASPGYVIVDINVDKKEKIKVHRIYISGNEGVKESKLKRAMKETKEKKLVNLFKSKKFIREKYNSDKDLLIDKYNEFGYRDAELISDSVVPYKDNKVDIYLKVQEGKKYYFRNITWVGNTVYPSPVLSAALGIKKGDVYNQKLLQEKLLMDEDAVSSLYLDNGYLFFNVDPVEVNIEGDSIDMEMRIYEGRQAVINEVIINGNTAVYEHVIRRELRTKPGQLFSRSDLQRSARELAQTGHFDPEKMDIQPKPNPEDGTVDIVYNLEQKRNDQVELSFGWGQTGVIGSLGLKFTNFSIQNIFNGESYRPLPQGDGQQLSLSFQTNASYYTAASLSFMEPWLGGKRPTSFSTSVYWSKQTGVNSSYYDNSYYNNYYNNSYYAYEADPDEYIVTVGAAVGVGTRLSWPDDYFSIYAELAYRHYSLNNWSYFELQTGDANNFSAAVTFSRNSLDNPYYTRRGSAFSLMLQATPPYSKFTDNSKTDELVAKYKNGTISNDEYKTMQQDLFRWVEYYKTEFKAKMFTPLSSNQKLVLMTRAEYGFLGYYNENRRSPFERYYVGGDGMSGYSSTYASTTVSLRGYENGSLTPRDPISGRQAGNIYTKLSMELRYPVMLQPTSTIYLLAFADAGNSWNEFNEFNPFDLKRSVGGGIRIFLPMIGLIGVDYGYGFDRDVDNKKGGGNLHLIIGQEF